MMGPRSQREFGVTTKHGTAVADLRRLGAVMLSVVQAAQPRAREPSTTVPSEGGNFPVRYGRMSDQNRIDGRAVLSVIGGEAGVITYAPGEPQQRPMVP
jgi:hypothetical protein